MSCKSDNDMDYNPLGESEDGNDHNISLTSQTSSKRVRSQYWDYFDAVLNSNRLATCRFCHVQISFRTTVSNLGKHLKKKHLAELASKVIPDPQPDRTLDSDYTKIGCEKKSHVMLYFDESVHEGKSLCKACDKEIASNESTSLMKHVLSHSKHDFVGKLDESLLEEDFLIGADPLEPRPGKKRSVAWRYFTVVDRERKLARCKLCKKVLAYAAGVSNLVKHVSRQHVGMELQDTDEDGESQPITQVSPVWAYFKCLDEAMSIASCLLCKKRVIFSEECRELYRHLHKKHPSIDLDKNTFGKTFMLTDDGELYEVETNKSGTAEAVDKTDNENESHTTEVYLDDDTFYEPEPKIKTHTKRKPSYVAHTPLLKLPKKEPVTEKEDSIELFGKYIVSLLKKLPKISSNRLQYEFVKQIFEAQHEKTVSEGTMTDDDSSVLDDEASNLSVKFSSEIWEQFEQEGSLSCCNICRMTTENTVEDMKNHLEEKHPGILIEIIKKKTDRADGESADEEMIEEDAVDEEAFTEVVYLEEEEPKRKFKNLVCKEGPRRKPKNPLKPTCSFVTLEPASSMKEKPGIEEYKFIPRTTTSVNMEEKQEIDSFLNYASVLLKNVPKASIPKLQLDIIGLIINAQIAHTNQSIPVPSLIHCTASNTDSTDEEIVQEETEAFTDDVYLEDELNVKSKNPFKRPRTGNLAPEPTVQEKPRVEYKTEHSKQEIDSFINYASVLIKNVLRESFPKLQLDIIALIMNAQISRILKPVPPIPSTMVITGPNHAVTVR